MRSAFPISVRVWLGDATGSVLVGSDQLGEMLGGANVEETVYGGADRTTNRSSPIRTSKNIVANIPGLSRKLLPVMRGIMLY